MPIVDADEFEKGEWQHQFEFGRARSCCDPLATQFLHALSREILRDKQARQYPDVMTFGYFCRNASIKKSLEALPNSETRVGWGTVVHISPSNIPINFAFSLAMGLVSGNSNIVRLPSRSYPQCELFIDIFDRVLRDPAFADIAHTIVFVRTERDSILLKELVAKTQGLVVWGGDATVSEFRRLPKTPRCIEVYFPNRVSAVAIGATEYVSLDDDSKDKLARAFFNDSYLVDQNACSSPSLVFWVGDRDSAEAAKKTFWDHLKKILDGEYKLDPVARIDKALDIMKLAESTDAEVQVESSRDAIWLLENPELRFSPLRFGTFLEIVVDEVSGIVPFLRNNEQTVTTFGVSGKALLSALLSAETAVDRVVPIGRALEIGFYWDGKDMLSLLSRRIDVDL